MPSNFIGIILSLFSATVWGASDFFGGISTRKHNQYAVLVFSGLAGILVIFACYLIWPEPFPRWPEAIWAVLAGTSGVIGLGALYYGLSMGHSATVAPTAAVIGAALPVVYGIFIDGLPNSLKLGGFILAFLGIWFVSSGTGAEKTITKRSILLAVIAGIAFGLFFIFISLCSDSLTFTPLIISRSTFITITGILLLVKRGDIGRTVASPIVWLTGIFDAGGNTLYMLARQFTRMDVAVVLSSIYPAITVVLSMVFLKEQISRMQWLGVSLCLIAVLLISM